MLWDTLFWINVCVLRDFKRLKINGNTNTTNINSKAKEKIINNRAIKWSLLLFKWGLSLLHGLATSIISEIFWIWTSLYLHLYMRKFQQIKFLTFTILPLYGSSNNIVLCCLFSTLIKMELHCMYSFVSNFFCSILCIQFICVAADSCDSFIYIIIFHCMNLPPFIHSFSEQGFIFHFGNVMKCTVLLTHVFHKWNCWVIGYVLFQL